MCQGHSRTQWWCLDLIQICLISQEFWWSRNAWGCAQKSSYFVLESWPLQDHPKDMLFPHHAMSQIVLMSVVYRE